MIEVVRKVLKDFSQVMPDILKKVENLDDVSNIKKVFDELYSTILCDEEGRKFLKSYKFPDDFLQISLDEIDVVIYPGAFFMNPFSYGKIRKFKTFLTLFSAKPIEFYKVYKQHPYLFDIDEFYVPCSTYHYGLITVKLYKYPQEIINFYEEKLVKPYVEHARTVFKSIFDDIQKQILLTYIENFTPADIILKYVSYEIVARFIYNIKVSPEFIFFIMNLPKDFIDYFEKNCEIKQDGYFPGLLIFCKQLSPENRRLYKKVLLHFLSFPSVHECFEALEQLGFDSEIIKVPASVVDILTPHEAFKVLERGLHLQKFYVDLPYEELKRKAFLAVLKNSSYVEKFQNITKAYQQLENDVNPKKAKVMFYEFCLQKMREYGKKSSVIREIYKRFKEKKLVAELIEEVFYANINKDELLSVKEGFIPESKKNVFVAYAEKIIDILKKDSDKDNNYLSKNA